MKKYIFAIFLFLLTTSVHFDVATRTIFAVRVSPQATGDMVTILVFFNNGHSNAYKKTLSLKEFCFFASGTWPSIYNRNRINLFELNGVNGGVIVDEFTKKPTHPYCPAIDSLWKIRFDKYPYKGKELEIGWSTDSSFPGKRQMNYLTSEYNIGNIDNHYFSDTNFWKILRDVVNPEWIDNYRYMQ